MTSEDYSIPHQIGRHAVPKIWLHMLPEDFHYFRIPDESASSCANCPKIADEGFVPNVKCCTYSPQIPNFLLGMALRDPKAKSLARSEINSGFALPVGKMMTPKETHRLLTLHTTNTFGKSTDLVCRFLDQSKGRCQFYAYRNSVCCTFFCISDKQKEGREFWEKTQALAGRVETALSHWSMETVGISAGDYIERFESFADKLDDCSTADGDGWSEEFLRTIWGDWFGKEEEFFSLCADRIDQNKSRLYELASSVELAEPEKFEDALRMSFSQAMQKEMEEQGEAGGTPVPIEDLWYLLQVAHRNLWQD